MADWALRPDGKSLVNLSSLSLIRYFLDGTTYRVVVELGTWRYDLVAPVATEAEAIAEVKRLGVQLGYVS